MDRTSLTKKSSNVYAPVILSLIGGIIIVISGFTLSTLHIAVFPHMDLMTGPSELLEQSRSMLAATIIITGSLVVVFAIILYKKPTNISAWGLIIVALSTLSILAMGGFMIGGIIGIIGGALAIDRKRTNFGVGH